MHMYFRRFLIRIVTLSVTNPPSTQLTNLNAISDLTLPSAIEDFMRVMNGPSAFGADVITPICEAIQNRTMST